MRIKILCLVFGLLLLYTIVQLIVIRKDNTSKVDRQIGIVETEFRKNQAEKLALIQEKNAMLTALGAIPETIRKGFEDPEFQFIEFMDHIKASDLKKMHGTLVISQMPTFKQSPVPLLETLFDIEFSIESTRQLESFLEYLLMGKYPLNVQRLEIKRTPQQLPRVFLKAALLLPAKIDLPQLTKTGKEAS